ncbi:flagellar basal body L-ring protein FlgH [bacterium]|nr:flagellar basal body L-ring protein FlgH [bacterium]
MNRPLFVIVCTIAFVVTVNAASLWDSGGGSLYSNQRAHRVGDILTVQIFESSAASSDAQTGTENKTEIGGGPGEGLLDFISLWGLTSENAFEGKGNTSRKGQLTATMSVRIVEVIPGEQYRIEGTRSVKRNGEEDKMLVTGLIRGRDIGPDNTIISSAIADAVIVYEGTGEIAQGHRPGVITKIVDWIF